MKVTKRLADQPDGRHLDVQLRGRWVHEFGDAKSSVDAHFASDPGIVFTVSDEDIARNSAVFGAGLSARVSKRTRLFVDYDTSFNADHAVHIVSAGLEYRW